MIMLKLNSDCSIAFSVHDICILFRPVGGDLRIFFKCLEGEGVGEYNFTEILVQCQFFEIFLAMCNFLAVSKYMTKLGEIADKNGVFNSYLFFKKITITLIYLFKFYSYFNEIKMILMHFYPILNILKTRRAFKRNGYFAVISRTGSLHDVARSL